MRRASSFAHRRPLWLRVAVAFVGLVALLATLEGLVFAAFLAMEKMAGGLR